MTQFRSFVLAAALSAAALPALAQTAQASAQDPAQDPAAAQTQPETPVPDAGIKKAPVVHTHHHARHVHARTTTHAAAPAAV